MVVVFGGCREASCIGVFVHTVQEALDYAEGDEAADVDVGELAAVMAIPLFDGLALFEARVEFDDADAVDNLLFFYCGGCVVCVVGFTGDVLAYGRPDVVWVEWKAGPEAVTSSTSNDTTTRDCARATWSRGNLAPGTRPRDSRCLSRSSGGGIRQLRRKECIHVAGAFALHILIGGNGRAKLGGWGVDSRKGEDVEE